MKTIIKKKLAMWENVTAKKNLNVKQNNHLNSYT